MNINDPMPTIQASAGRRSSSTFEHGTNRVPTVDEKPPYRVPTMDEIRSIPWNGFKVVSTFSGCGGSCTGYRMAGFKVVWANEFVPAAQASYKANAEPDCILDPRDIRAVQPKEILTATGLAKGELDLFDGSPPCQAFSTAGKRHKGWGQVKTYEHGAKQCNETLFDEYVRILRWLMPKAFIAENVSGLVKGVAKGYFLEILAALKASGYRVACRVLDAQWLGVPQTRQRTIFVGVREDLSLDPIHPKPLPYRYSVRDALPYIDSFATNASYQERWKSAASAAILAGGGSEKGGMVQPLPPSKMAGAYGVKEVDPEKPCPTVTIASPGNDLAVPYIPNPETDISGFAIGKEWDKLSSGESSKKYRSLVKPSLVKPSPTIQACHGNLSTAGVTHPIERRKFTIAELKRICAFPDDFVLIGSYAQQWERLGNSVPPVMMKYIAEAIRDRILLPLAKLSPSPVG